MRLGSPNLVNLLHTTGHSHNAEMDDEAAARIMDYMYDAVPKPKSPYRMGAALVGAERARPMEGVRFFSCHPIDRRLDQYVRRYDPTHLLRTVTAHQVNNTKPLGLSRTIRVALGSMAEPHFVRDRHQRRKKCSTYACLGS